MCFTSPPYWNFLLNFDSTLGDSFLGFSWNTTSSASENVSSPNSIPNMLSFKTPFGWPLINSSAVCRKITLYCFLIGKYFHIYILLLVITFSCAYLGWNFQNSVSPYETHIFPLPSFEGHLYVQDSVVTATNTTRTACSSSLGSDINENPQLHDY